MRMRGRGSAEEPCGSGARASFGWVGLSLKLEGARLCGCWQLGQGQRSPVRTQYSGLSSHRPPVTKPLFGGCSVCISITYARRRWMDIQLPSWRAAHLRPQRSALNCRLLASGGVAESRRNVNRATEREARAHGVLRAPSSRTR